MKSSTAHPPAQLPLPPVTLAVKRKRSYVVEVPYMCLRKLRKRLYSKFRVIRTLTIRT